MLIETWTGLESFKQERTATNTETPPSDAHQQGARTLWFTGLSGAGKTTLARRLEAEIRARNFLVEVLDGDLMRKSFSDGLGFTREDRDRNVKRIGFVSHLLSRNGVFALAAAISPYRDARREVRLMHEPDRFIEVFVNCPIQDLIARDEKGLYAKALRGEIPLFTGVSDPYEPPEKPEIVVNTNLETVEQSLGHIVDWLVNAGYLSSSNPSHPL